MGETFTFFNALKKNTFFLSFSILFVNVWCAHGATSYNEKKKQEKEQVSQDYKEKPLSDDQRNGMSVAPVKEFVEDSSELLISGKLFPTLSPKKESIEDILRKRKAANLLELERSIKRGGRRFEKKEDSKIITCKDILGGYLSLPQDADVNAVCHECYAYCLMEMVLLQVLVENDKSTLGKKLNEATLKKVRDSLLVIQALTPALLSGCVAAFIAFRYEENGGMRQRINELQKAVQNP